MSNSGDNAPGNEYASQKEGGDYDLDAEDALDNYVVVLIREEAGGTRYSNQSGGYSCAQPVVRGEHACQLPHGEAGETVSDMLMAYFTQMPHRGWCCEGISESDARFVDAAMTVLDLAKWGVDRRRLADSMEAWVWVVDANGNTGVFCWENSD